MEDLAICIQSWVLICLVLFVLLLSVFYSYLVTSWGLSPVFRSRLTGEIIKVKSLLYTIKHFTVKICMKIKKNFRSSIIWQRNLFQMRTKSLILLSIYFLLFVFFLPISLKFSMTVIYNQNWFLWVYVPVKRSWLWFLSMAGSKRIWFLIPGILSYGCKKGKSFY